MSANVFCLRGCLSSLFMITPSSCSRKTRLACDSTSRAPCPCLQQQPHKNEHRFYTFTLPLSPCTDVREHPVKPTKMTCQNTQKPCYSKEIGDKGDRKEPRGRKCPVPPLERKEPRGVSGARGRGGRKRWREAKLICGEGEEDKWGASEGGQERAQRSKVDKR